MSTIYSIRYNPLGSVMYVLIMVLSHMDDITNITFILMIICWWKGRLLPPVGIHDYTGYPFISMQNQWDLSDRFSFFWKKNRPSVCFFTLFHPVNWITGFNRTGQHTHVNLTSEQIQRFFDYCSNFIWCLLDTDQKDKSKKYFDWMS